MHLIKPLIKVPLVLCENLLFSIFPGLRSFIERSLYNPLDFREKHIDYSRKKFQEFSALIHPHSKLEDSILLELGPGGSIGFGLLALRAGAKKYIALDDGQHVFIKESHLKGYQSLLNNDSAQFDHYFVQTASGSIGYNPALIEFISIDQQSRYPLANASVDIIYSCAVLEHVHDLDLCFAEMTRVLRPGGTMYHEVDLRDHIFSQKSLFFLTLSDHWFRTLFQNTGGYVNRKRISCYRSLAEKYGLSLVALEEKNESPAPTVPQRIVNQYSEEDLRTLSFIAVFLKNE